MAIEKYTTKPAGQRDPLIRYRLRIRTKIVGLDGIQRPYTVDELFPTRAAALEAQERHWAYIRGEQAQKDILMLLERAKEPSLGDLLRSYYEKHTSRKAASAQSVEKLRLTKVIPGTLLPYGSQRPDEDELFRHPHIIETLGRFYVAFGFLRVSKVDKKMILRYIAAREKKGAGGATIRRELVLISTAFERLEDLYGIKLENPVSLLRDDEKPRVNPARERVLSEGEEKALLTAADKAKNPEVGLLFRLALGTAMRRSELFSLAWEKVSFETRSADLGRLHKAARAAETKGRKAKSRRVLLLPLAFDALKAFWEAKGKPASGPVFSYSADGFKTATRRVIDAAALEDFHFHDLRHTALTRLSAAGWTPMQVAKSQGVADVRHLEERVFGEQKTAALLQAVESGKALSTSELMQVAGHASPAMTAVYANLTPADAPAAPHEAKKRAIRVRKDGAAFVAFCETEEGLLEAEGETAAEAKSLLLSML